MSTRLLTAGLILVLLAASPSPRAAEEKSEDATEATEVQFDSELGALKMLADWQESVFVILDADGETVQAIPKTTEVPYGRAANFKPPEGFGYRGAWLELPPGQYMLWVLAPGKRIVQEKIELVRGKELFASANLGEEDSKMNVSEPRDKSGPQWRKGP